MSAGSDAQALAREVWPALAARLGALGPLIADAPFPADERSTIEGVRALTRLATLGFQWCVEFGDPDAPAFYRHDDDVTKWGGPNADNTYMRARVRGDATYVVRGNVRGPHGFVISTHEGDMQLEQYGVYAEIWHDELEVDDDGAFALHVGGPERATNWIPLDERTTNITIRQYFHDWARDVPTSFHIERVGAEGEPAPPLTADVLRARLDEALEWVERSVHYWNRYVAEALDRCGPNHLLGAGGALGGSNGIAYGFGCIDLADDEAFVIETAAPDAWTWNFMLYNVGWMESLDLARTTSLNATQLVPDDDGKVRIVVAHHDPGTPNWLDVSGHRRTMLAYRYIRTRTKPTPTGRVVALDAVRDALPASTPYVDAASRARQVAARRAHLSRRFRC